MAVYKKVGADKNLVKIEKPSITKVNLNRNKKSDFFKKINDTKVEKIKPRFLDFEQDLQFDKLDNIPIIYKKNEENDFFEFTYLFDFGKNFSILSNATQIRSTFLLKIRLVIPG